MRDLLAAAARDEDGAARLSALTGLPAPSGEATSIISYRSAGQVAVIGPLDRLRAAARALAAASTELQCTLLVSQGATVARTEEVVPTGTDNGQSETGPRTIYAKLVALRGHLGQFEIDMELDGEVQPLAPSLVTAHRPFDLVLDLGEPAMLSAQIPPPGYVAVGAAAGPDHDEARLAEAAGQLADLVGEFEKPRYFNYEPDICAHGRSGQSGCTRCIDACPTNAIASLKEIIEVDPYLCQGGGACATACPTGAIEYAYPGPADQSNYLSQVLGAYLERTGSPPTLVFHDGEAGLEWLAPIVESLPGSVLPWQVEEVGSTGMDIWLSALAHGAGRVAVLCPQSVPASVMTELRFQMEVARTIASSLGLDENALVLVPVEPGVAAPGALTEAAPAVGFERARFASTGDKRARLRLAIDHLHSQAANPPAACELPDNAPFGEIAVDTKACTLCMACVSVCPASALLAGGDTPRLSFIEQNCVQCGLCERACPETAITRHARLSYDREARAARRTLNEDEPWACPSCGKPFATRGILARMRAKLAGHWMYQDNPDALRRMELCDECRVKDMFRDGGGLLDPHLGPQRPPGGNGSKH